MGAKPGTPSTDLTVCSFSLEEELLKQAKSLGFHPANSKVVATGIMYAFHISASNHSYISSLEKKGWWKSWLRIWADKVRISYLAQTQKCWPHHEEHVVAELGFLLSPSPSTALFFLLQYQDDASAAIDAISAFYNFRLGPQHPCIAECVKKKSLKMVLSTH